jgi:hypothetical protein
VSKTTSAAKNDLSPFSSLFVCGAQAVQVAARNINTIEKMQTAQADRLKSVTQEKHRLKPVLL